MGLEKISAKNSAEKIIDYNFSQTGNGSDYLNTLGYSSVKNLFFVKKESHIQLYYKTFFLNKNYM